MLPVINSTRYRVFYSVQKYAEGPIAGALLIADTPHDRMREFRHSTVEVSSSMRVHELSRVVKWWLDRPQLLQNKAETAQRWAMHSADTNAFFEQATELYFGAIARGISGLDQAHGGEGGVGKVFLSPFYVRCRGAGGEPWCGREQRNKRPHNLIHGGMESPGLYHPRFGGHVPPVAVDQRHENCTPIAPPAYQGRWKPLRWLLLRPNGTKTAAVAPFWRRLSAQALHSAFVAQCVSWGPGWGGWNARMTLRENVKQRFGDDEHFDLILVSDDDDVEDEPWIINRRSLRTEIASFADTRVVVVLRKECRTGCVEEGSANSTHKLQRLGDYRPNIVQLDLAPQNMLYGSQGAVLHELSRDALVVHSPRVGYYNPAVIHKETSAEDRVDVLLLGLVSGAIFVDRPAWHELLTPTGAAQLRNLLGTDIRVQYLPASAIVDDEQAYLRVLARATLILAPNGHGRSTPAVWEDALLSGRGLVVSSPPHERMREFSRFSVTVPHTASADKIGSTISHWLSEATAVARRNKRGEGKRWAEHNTVVRSYIEDTLESYWEVVEQPYGEGLVGFKFPYSWRTSCMPSPLQIRGNVSSRRIVGRWCGTLSKKVVPHWLVKQ